MDIHNALNSHFKGASSPQHKTSNPEDVLDKINELESFGEVFYIPFIKLVGYGRKQTYQCVCVKCKELYFNLNIIKDLTDLFCSYCKPSKNFLHEENISISNYVGIIIGWEIKLAADLKKRSFYNYKKVYKRDGYQCQFCNYSFKNSQEFRPLHIDHLKPWSAGGANSMDNMVVSCSKCNLHASDKWFHSFFEKKKYVNQFVPEIPIKLESYECD